MINLLRIQTCSVEELPEIAYFELRSVFAGCISCRMSISSKSPRKVLLAAYATAQDVLPAYGHRFSPRTFTQYQLFACLVLKMFLKQDYRGIVALLEDCLSQPTRDGLPTNLSAASIAA